MKEKEWYKRFAERSDMSTRLIHLTKPSTIYGKDLNVCEIMLKILGEKKLIGSTTSTGFICGDTSAVCFQDAPLHSVTQNVYYEQKIRESNKSKKIRYLGWGFLFEKPYIYLKGGRPVIYDKTSDAQNYLHKNQWWRIVNLNLVDSENYIDWTHEREWRIPGDFEFELDKVTLFVPQDKALKYLCKEYKNRYGKDILEDVKGIINLSDIFY